MSTLSVNHCLCALFCQSMPKYVELGIPLGGAIAGVIDDQFHETDLARGCWVSHPKKPCLRSGDDVVATDTRGVNVTGSELVVDEDYAICRVELDPLGRFGFAWNSTGFPSVILLVALIVNNTIIFGFVRKTIYNHRGSNRHRTTSSISDTQIQRVRQVAVQAFLYVAACFVTLSVPWVLRVMEDFEVFTVAEEDKILPS